MTGYMYTGKKSVVVEAAWLAVGITLLPFVVVWIGCDVVVARVKPPIKRQYNKYRSKRHTARTIRAEERKARERIKNAPQPLPDPRARRLSTLQCEQPKALCRFLTFVPLEIRQEIYSYVLGGDLKHIVRKGKRLAHVRCNFPWETDFQRSCRHAAAGTCHQEASMLASTANGNVAMLRTCRQIYNEAVKIMYSRNTFDFDHQDLFLFFAQNILPQRLAAIRVLHLSLAASTIKQSFPWANAAPRGWSLMWHVIAKHMPGLRHLRIRLVGEPGAPYPTVNGDWWMESILQVRKLKTFHLDFRAPTNNWNEFGDGVFEMSALLEDHIRRVVCSDP